MQYQMNENDLNFNLYLSETEFDQVIKSLEYYLEEAEVSENVNLYTEINSLISKINKNFWM